MISRLLIRFQLVSCLFIICGYGFQIVGGALGSLTGMLHPIESESRQIQYLDGMWDFRADQSYDRAQGLRERWYLQALIEVRITGWISHILTL